MTRLRIVRVIDEKSLMNGSLKAMIAEVFLGVLAAVQDRSPHDFGRLVNSLAVGGGVSQLKDDRAIVGTNVDYGYKLDAESQYHYREHKSYAGEQTQGWFSTTVTNLKFDDVAKDGARAAEAFWSG